MEQILTGFLHTWATFMVTSPLPEVDSEYQLEDLGDKYRLTYKEGSASVVTSMTHDFAIDEMNVKTPEFEGAVHPTFAREKGRYLLTGYEGTYKSGTGDPQHLSVRIENQAVEGFNLPQTVTALLPTPAGRIEFVLNFTEYHLKKR